MIHLTSGQKTFILACILCVLGFAIYSPGLQSPFQFDDYINVVENSKIKDLESLIFGGPKAQNFVREDIKRVVAYYSFALNFYFHKDRVFGYHLVNSVIHIMCALLVWWFMRLIWASPKMRLGEDGESGEYKQAVAFLAAMLFLVHPLQTESVTYITQRFTSMAAMFYLLSICLYMQGRLSFGRDRITAVACWMGAASAAVLGMLTKETVFTLPLCILLIETYFFRGKKDYGKTFWVAALFILLFALIIPAIFSFDLKYIFHYRQVVQKDGINSWTYLLTQFRVIVHYIRMLFFPLGQNIDYDFPLSRSPFELPVMTSFVFLTALIAFAVKIRSRNRLVSFGIIWFFLTLSVESSIIPIKDLCVEHRLYLPLVGFCMAACSGLCCALKDWKKCVLVLCAVICVFGGLTVRRNMLWKDGAALWADAVKKSPNKARAYHNLGFFYLKHKQWDLAAKNFTYALERKANYIRAYMNRGNAYARTGRYKKALADYGKAIALKEDYPAAYYNRGKCFFEMFAYNEALKDYTTALTYDNHYAVAYFGRATLYTVAHDDAKALADLDKAIESDPFFYDAYNNRGNIYGRMNLSEKAIADYNQAIAIDPYRPNAYNNRGVEYKAQGLYEQALSDYTKVIELDPEYVQAYHNKGSVYVAMGQYDKALVEYGKALDLGPMIQTYFERGKLYAQLKEYDHALRDFDRAIEINPGFVEIYRERENVYRKRAESLRSTKGHSR